MKKILYIEDEQDQIDLLQERLNALGYELIYATDGLQGLKMAEEQNPDLILLDLFMPKIKGFDICKRIKQREKTKDIPVIIVTASGTDHLPEQCRFVGATDYIKKPYDSKELEAKIKTALNISG